MGEIEVALQSKSRNELLVIAKKTKLRGYSSLNKKQLLKKIQSEANPTLLAQVLGLRKFSKVKKVILKALKITISIIGVIGVFYGIFYTMNKSETQKHFEALKEDSKKGDKIIYEFHGGSGEVFDYKYDGSTGDLEKRYPYGFKLIGVKYPDSIFQGPASANLKSIYDVNWYTLKVKIDKERGVVDIVLPVENIQNGSDFLSNVDMAYSVPLKETYAPSRIPIKLNIEAHLYFQLLEESDQSPVYVFGFK